MSQATNPTDATSRKPEARGAQRRDDARLSWRAWREQHAFSLFASLGHLWRHPLATLFTLLVMALALSMPLILALTLKQLDAVQGALSHSSAITVFFQTEAEAEQIKAHQQTWRAWPEVTSVELQSPSQGMAELRGLEGFGEALDALDRNPLPWVAHVQARDPARAAVTRLATRIEAEAGVDFVQHDQRWFERLQAVMRLIRRFALLLGIAFGLGAILIVGNTIRLDVHQRAEEIRVLQSLGAEQAFVRRPHLYAGAWYGLWGGILALLLVFAALWLLRGSLSQLASIYGLPSLTTGLDAKLVTGTLLIGLALGWTGALWASAQQMRATRLQ